MRNASINYVKNLIMRPLFVELLDEAGRNIYDLDDGFVLKTARFYLEVTRIFRASVVSRDQFKYLFVKVRVHDAFQRVLVIFALGHIVLFVFGGSDIYLCEYVKTEKMILRLS